MIDLAVGSVFALETMTDALLLERPVSRYKIKSGEKARVRAARTLPNCEILDKTEQHTHIKCGLGKWWIENKLWRVKAETEEREYNCVVEGDLHYLPNFPFFSNKAPSVHSVDYFFCQVACLAMCLKYLELGNIQTHEQYLEAAKKHRDGRHHYYNRLTLLDLGVSAKHTCCLGPDDIKDLIDSGMPVPCAVVVRGHWTSPHGLAYYVVIYGYDKNDWLCMDPFGVIRQDKGGWTDKGGDCGKEVRYSMEKMDKRLFHGGGYSAWGWVNFSKL
jgi:hypothetical protein